MRWGAQTRPPTKSSGTTEKTQAKETLQSSAFRGTLRNQYHQVGSMGASRQAHWGDNKIGKAECTHQNTHKGRTQLGGFTETSMGPPRRSTTTPAQRSTTSTRGSHLKEGKNKSTQGTTKKDMGRNRPANIDPMRKNGQRTQQIRKKLTKPACPMLGQ